jgi:two-component sensor histidine kinase
MYSDRAVAEPRLRPELAAVVGLLADHHRLVQQLRRDSEAVAASGRRLMTIDELSHDSLVDELRRTLLPHLKELRAESQKLTDRGVRTWLSQATLSVEHELDAVSSTRGVSAKELVPELIALAGRFETHIHVSAGDVQVDDLSARTLLFVASEGTVNAIKHGTCSNIWIDLRQIDDDIELSVGDDGRGGARIQPGHGLEGLRDRLAPLHGSLTIAETPGGGTAISVRLPAVSERASVDFDPVAG